MNSGQWGMFTSFKLSPIWLQIEQLPQIPSYSWDITQLYSHKQAVNIRQTLCITKVVLLVGYGWKGVC